MSTAPNFVTMATAVSFGLLAPQTPVSCEGEQVNTYSSNFACVFDFTHSIHSVSCRSLTTICQPGKLSHMSDNKESDYSKTQGEGPIKVSYIFPNGDKYEGECSRSASGVMMRSGTGKHTSAGGVIYIGEWLEDKMHGRGTLHHTSGALYEGEFKDNMYHGTGTYTFPDGSTYKGHFHKNRLEGDGAFTNTQGLVWTGEFHGKAALGLKMQHNI